MSSTDQYVETVPTHDQIASIPGTYVMPEKDIPTEIWCGMFNRSKDDGKVLLVTTGFDTRTEAEMHLHKFIKTHNFLYTDEINWPYFVVRQRLPLETIMIGIFGATEAESNERYKKYDSLFADDKAAVRKFLKTQAVAIPKSNVHPIAKAVLLEDYGVNVDTMDGEFFIWTPH